MTFADLDLNRTYTYAGYFNWPFEERVELIKGKVYSMGATPNRLHQELSVYIHASFYSHQREHKCESYAAPFDVRIPGKSKEDKDIITVVQPDLCVVCDLTKLDERGCIGAPDIVVEILSPSNNKKELKYKYEVYEEAGVLEYWIVYPTEPGLVINVLTNGKYVPSRMMVQGDVATSAVLPGFSIALDEWFERIGE